jgi:polar amino acid transport system substrate-binding protein
VTRNVPKVLLLLLMISAIVVAVSGCTTSPTVTPTPTAVVNASATPAPTQNMTLLTPGTLSIATEAHYPPFENINTDTGDFEGFDIDVMNEIGKDLGLNVTYTDHAFDTIITAVQAKKFDAAISAFTITPERQQSIDFTDWYYESPGQAITVRADETNIKNASDIVGKKVGVQMGTVGQDAVKNFEGVNPDDIKAYATMNEAFMALKKGEVDAVVGDQPVSEPYIKNYPGDYKFVGEPLTATEYFGIVVNKDNPGLTAAMNQALAKMKEDGRLQSLHDKWFE